MKPCASVWSWPNAGMAAVESPGWSGHCGGMRPYPAAIRSPVTGGRSKRVSAEPGGCAAAGGIAAGGTGGTAGRSNAVAAGSLVTRGRSNRVAPGSASPTRSAATAGRSNAVGASGAAFACRPIEP